MEKTIKRAYECPEAEILDFVIESGFMILSVTDGKDDPVGGAQEGDVDDWEWN